MRIPQLPAKESQIPQFIKKIKKSLKESEKENEKSSIASFRIYPAEWIQRLWLYGL